jgi:hypothetical protein
MSKATTDEEREALYDLIEQIRNDQDAKTDEGFWTDLEEKLDKVANLKVTRTGTRPRPSYRYAAAHKRATKPADDCHQTITDAEKKDEIERLCASCAKKAKFKFEKEVTPDKG